MECGICALPNLDEVEEAAQDGLSGAASWKGLGERFGVNRQSLKNHMERHWVAPASATEQAVEGLDAAIAENIEQLLEQMRFAPAEVKPFYAVAIQNLKALADTKPSQQNLINSLKAITEVTGMKQEQHLMLEFARHAFKKLDAAESPALPLPVIDVEVIEE